MYSYYSGKNICHLWKFLEFCDTPLKFPLGKRLLLLKTVAWTKIMSLSGSSAQLMAIQHEGIRPWIPSPQMETVLKHFTSLRITHKVIWGFYWDSNRTQTSLYNPSFFLSLWSQEHSLRNLFHVNLQYCLFPKFR